MVMSSGSTGSDPGRLRPSVPRWRLRGWGLRAGTGLRRVQQRPVRAVQGQGNRASAVAGRGHRRRPAGTDADGQGQGRRAASAGAAVRSGRGAVRAGGVHRADGHHRSGSVHTVRPARGTLAGTEGKRTVSLAAAFVRVSTGSQDESSQVKVIDDYAEANGLTIVKTFRLREYSASKGTQEPALREAIDIE